MPIRSINGEPIEIGTLSGEPLVWEIGSIGSLGQDINNNNTRIRTHGRVRLTEGTNIKFWCDEGYKFCLAIYNDDVGYYKSDYWHGNVSDGFYGAKGFTFWQGAELRIVLARIDDSVMTDTEDSSALHMSIYAPSRLDVTHGNWTVGSIRTNGNDRELDSYINFCRTTGFYSFKTEQIEVEFADGYSGRCMQYDNGLHYIQRSDLMYEGTNVVQVEEGTLYRFQVSYGSDLQARLDPQLADNAVVVREIHRGSASTWSDEDERLLQQSRYSSYWSGTNPSVEENLTLVHFSDIHGDPDRAERIVKFASDHDGMVDDVVFTGDLISARWSDAYQWWYDIGAGDVLVSLGNHDYKANEGSYDDISGYVTMADAYARYFNGFSSWGAVSGGTNKTYWYKDYTDKKVRLFGLDLVLDGLSPDSEQLDWFVLNLANARRDGLSVIVAEHYPVNNRQAIDGVGAWYDNDYNFSDRLQWKVADRWHDAIEDFVEAGGEFVCWLVGHTHADLVSVNSAYPSQIVLDIDAANPTRAIPYTDTAREVDTPTQDCFNIVSVDTRSKTIRIVRIGASENQYMQSKKALCLNYLTGAVKGMI